MRKDRFRDVGGVWLLHDWPVLETNLACYAGVSASWLRNPGDRLLTATDAMRAATGWERVTSLSVPRVARQAA